MDKYLAIDIGGSFIKYSQVDELGTFKKNNKTKTPKSLPELKKVIENLIEEFDKGIKGVGISCPGRIDITTGVVYNGGALPYLHEFPLKDFIETKFNIPCAVINDGKSAALSELWLGNLKNISNGAAIVLGTGVGCGIIIDGNLVQGSHFQAGELSFLLRSPGLITRDNMIGFSGSAVNFIKACSVVLELEENDGVGVFKAIELGENKELIHIFESYCREIAFVILNLQATLDIEKIVIGGGISSQELLLAEIKNQYLTMRKNFNLWNDSWEIIAVDACKFKNKANLLGAIYQLLLNLEKIQNDKV